MRLAAAATGCAPHQAITVASRTNERVHVEAQQAFVGYSLFQNPQRFRFVVEPGRVWSSGDAAVSDRASLEGGEGVMLIRVREPDVLAEWTAARFEAVAALSVSIDRDAGGRLLVVREAEKPDKGQ